MTNPFNDSPHGRDGTDPEFGTLTTQGFHSLQRRRRGRRRQARDRLRRGDHRPRRQPALQLVRRAAAAAAPTRARRPGSGTATRMHVTDIDPDRPGLEIYMVHEGGRVGAVRATRCATPRPAR